ncbi:MAG: DNA-processing protein DprA [Actinomycetia bacterium]|nr:DNA-processing protein DprA [Actinomycetes bacterium]
MTTNALPYLGYHRLELSSTDGCYPDCLKELEAVPPRLCLIGNSQLLEQPMLAIVGARKATPYGLNCSRRFARRAALRGVVVVSGGAVGCDQAAHKGALEMDAQTIVVLGSGADVAYPAKAAPLFEQVLSKGGLLLSELPWGSAPMRWAFRKRNRLIAALGQATLIIEAGLPSGTFSTADATLALGKELLVVPGSIYSQQSSGANRLIAQGAWPIIDDESFDHALSVIFPHQLALSLADDAGGGRCDGRLEAAAMGSGTAAAAESGNVCQEGNGWPPPSGEQTELLARLASMPSRPDELVGGYGKSIIEVIRYLSVLELSGHVERLPDGRYAAIRHMESWKGGYVPTN